MKARTISLAMGAAATSVAGLTVGKATRDTLFVATFPVDLLPYALILTGVVSATCVSGYTKLTSRFSPRVVAPVFPLVFAVLLSVATALLVREKSTIVVGVLYVALTVGSSLTVSGFWSLLSEMIDVRSARRSLGGLTLMSSVGGFIGALVSSAVLGATSARWLLLIVAVMNLAASVFLFAMSRGAPRSIRGGAMESDSQSSGPSMRSRAGLREGLSAIAGNAYLRNIALFVGITAVAGTIGDYLLKSVASSTLQSEEALAQFFVTFHGVVAGLTLAAQLLVAQPMLEKRGLAATLALLPALLLMGAAAFVYLPTLVFASALRGGEMTIRNSAHKAAYELLFVPISNEAKRKTRAIFDTLLDRVADGVGAVMLLGLIAASASLNLVGACAALLAGASAFLVLRIRAGYVDSLTARLADAGDQAANLDPAILSEVVARETIQRTLAGVTREELERFSQTSFGRAVKDRGATLASGGTLIAQRAPVAKVRSAGSNLVAALASEDDEEVSAKLTEWTGRDRVVLPVVVHLLARGGTKKAAQKALIQHVDHHVGALGDHLLDAMTPMGVRLAIPRVLGESRSPRAVGLLLAVLADEHAPLRFRAGRALRELASRGLGPARDAVWAAIRVELQRRTPTLPPPSSVPAADGSGSGSDETNTVRRHVFDLLALNLDPRPIDLAFDAIRSADEARGAVALEYLENVVPSDLRAPLLQSLGRVVEPEAPMSRRAVEAIVRDLDSTKS